MTDIEYTCLYCNHKFYVDYSWTYGELWCPVCKDTNLKATKKQENYDVYGYNYVPSKRGPR